MAKYGNEFYGLATYGADTLVDFDATPFTASSTNYNQILVEWTLPTGDWDRIRLVRNTFGFPMTPDDGDLLWEDINSTNDREYLDNGQVPNESGLLGGQTYYYSIFVRRGGTRDWVRAGNALGISVKRYGTPDLMYDYIPAIQRIANMNSFISDNAVSNSDLYRFLEIFGFEYDLFKTTAENVKNRYDLLKLDGRLIPLMLNQFGFQFEQEIGIQQARSLLRNAIKIYGSRGSAAGIRTFVSAFTGYNCDIKPVTNLMLGLNDSSFRESIGFWESLSNTTLARGTATTETPAISPYEEPNSPSNFPNSAVGFLKTTAVAAGAMELVCGQSSILKRAIPIEAGKQYTFSVYSRAKTSARTVAVDIRWYTVTGTFLGTAGEASYTNNTTAWTRSGASTGTAPADARFAVPYIRVDGAALGEIHYFDAAQFEKGSSATTFADARRVDVILRANRINQVINPSFETDLNNWTSPDGTLSRVSDSANEYGDYCAALTSSVSGEATLGAITTIGVIPGDQHAASGYVKGPSSITCRIKVLWFSEGGDFISADYGPFVTLSGSWQRVVFDGLAPANAFQARLVFEYYSTAFGDIVYLDDVLFEKAAYVSPYFDGDKGYELYGDVLWETGSDNDSRSHYYKNREVVTKRLTSVLGEYVPSGSAWAVFVAQPD